MGSTYSRPCRAHSHVQVVIDTSPITQPSVRRLEEVVLLAEDAPGPMSAMSMPYAANLMSPDGDDLRSGRCGTRSNAV
jgi:hypothetical protein